MTNQLSRWAVVGAVAVATACGADSPPQSGAATGRPGAASTSVAVPSGLARVDFHVEGMTCGGCEAGTRAVLRKVEGVQDAGASYPGSSAWAVYDPARATPEQMMAAIRQLGYTPSVVQGGSATPAS